MGWLKRMFGLEKPEETEEEAVAEIQEAAAAAQEAAGVEEIPPERVGLFGEYDQSGLAKRVVAAFDDDDELDDEERLWVAQTGGKVVLKGEVSSQDILDKMVDVAMGVDGSTEVDTEQVTVLG
ncbi:MAG: BON domain-containing protein [Hormoscilla sp.]